MRQTSGKRDWELELRRSVTSGHRTANSLRPYDRVEKRIPSLLIEIRIEKCSALLPHFLDPTSSSDLMVCVAIPHCQVDLIGGRSPCKEWFHIVAFLGRSAIPYNRVYIG